MTANTCLLISPASLFDPKDPFTTGVIYMPIGLAYGASSLQQNGFKVEVMDLFGNDPTRAEKLGNYIRLGSEDLTLIEKVAEVQPLLIVFYANQVLNHASLVKSISTVRQAYPNLFVGVAENTQAVTAYYLADVADEFFNCGVDFILSGEMENTLPAVFRYLQSSLSLKGLDVEGVSTNGLKVSHSLRINDLDSLVFPAWELFPISNYWKVGYAHGPFETKSYLPLLTSRGCPFPCKFCVVPSTNNRKWRSRSAKNVVDEMELMLKKFGVREFHLEDLNPTINDVRMVEISKEILRRELDIVWKIVAGTKIESVKSLETLRWMNKAGLNYVSMSPETGSRRIQRDIGKTFNTSHALKMISESRKLGVSTQACFVLGYPAESFLDRLKTFLLAIRLTLSGLDEVVVFIMSPVPGSSFFSDYKGQYNSLSDLGFSPRWRSDFFGLMLWRVFIYFFFMFTKFVTRPVVMLGQIRNMFGGSFRTKMEMVPLRGIKYLGMAKKIKSGIKLIS